MRNFFFLFLFGFLVLINLYLVQFGDSPLIHAFLAVNSAVTFTIFALEK